MKKIAVLAIISLFFMTNIIPAASIKEESIKSLGSTIYVDDDGSADYTKIQDAIDNASEGDTIFVYNGTYYGEIYINKTINLIGEDRNNTIINESSEGRIVNVLADYVNISGFTLQNSCNIWEIEGAIYLLSRYNTIENNIIRNNSVGIRFRYWEELDTKPEFNRVHNNIFQNNDEFIVLSSGCNNNSIENNILMGSSHSRVGSSNNNTIRNNKVITNDSCTISILGSHNNTISYNSFISRSGNSIYLEKSNYNNIHNNYISNVFGRGIFIENSSFNNIHHNNFLKCLFKANFLKSEKNIWDNNYWGKSRFLPKPIFGRIGKNSLILWVNFDLHPAREPNEI